MDMLCGMNDGFVEAMKLIGFSKRITKVVKYKY